MKGTHLGLTCDQKLRLPLHQWNHGPLKEEGTVPLLISSLL